MRDAWIPLFFFKCEVAKRWDATGFVCQIWVICDGPGLELERRGHVQAGPLARI